MTLDESWRTAGADPFVLEEHPSVTNAVIDKTHVTGLGTITFVADPLVVLDGETYYLFYEASKPGTITTICYSTSADGLTWTFGGEVLNATHAGTNHLSYPQVISVDGEWYMIPTSSDDAIVLWHATTFPTAWERMETMIAGTWGPRDATVFQFGGVFYLLVYDTTNEICKLYFSDTLFGSGWTQHPSSPILSGVRNSRPGGRPIVRAESVDILLQDSVTTYGNKTRIYKLTNLSKTTVTATELAGSPLLEASGVGDAWNELGMHTLDRISASVSIVDGKNKDVNEVDIWSIGIYRDVP